MARTRRTEKQASRILAQRTCRVVLDVTVRVHELTPAALPHRLRADMTGVGLPPDWVERQHRLLLALLEDEQTLVEYLTIITIDELEEILDHEGLLARGTDVEDELLARVYERLGGDDARFFREVRVEGLLAENTQLIDWAFVLDWVGAQLKEVRVVEASGDKRDVGRKMSGDYVRFRQDVLAALERDRSGRAVRAYMRLVCAPAELWIAETVLRLTGEPDNPESSAWAQLVKLVGRKEKEVRATLAWLAQEGIIRYEAADERVEIRVELVGLQQLNWGSPDSEA